MTETLPDGFTYVESSLQDGARPDGRAITFTLLADESFTYTVTAPAEEGAYTFAGVFWDSHKDERRVGGQSRVVVRATPPPISLVPSSPATLPVTGGTATDGGRLTAWAETGPAPANDNSRQAPATSARDQAAAPVLLADLRIQEPPLVVGA